MADEPDKSEKTEDPSDKKNCKTLINAAMWLKAKN